MKQTAPILYITVVGAVPNKTGFVCVSKKERGTIEAVFAVEVFYLLRSRSLAQDCCGRSTWHEFDKEGDQRYHRPDDQKHQGGLPGEIQEFVFHAEGGSKRIL